MGAAFSPLEFRPKIAHPLFLINCELLQGQSKVLTGVCRWDGHGVLLIGNCRSIRHQCPSGILQRRSALQKPAVGVGGPPDAGPLHSHVRNAQAERPGLIRRDFDIYIIKSLRGKIIEREPAARVSGIRQYCDWVSTAIEVSGIDVPHNLHAQVNVFVCRICNDVVRLIERRTVIAIDHLVPIHRGPRVAATAAGAPAIAPCH